MARPAKASPSKTGVVTKEEEAIRRETEKRLRGSNDELIPPDYLTDGQKEIFNYIVKNTEAAELLGNLDVYILSFTAVTIDKLEDIDIQFNKAKDPNDIRALVIARSTISKDFFRCCNELSLSPQARAKISIANVKAVKTSKNPLLEALEL